MDDVDDVYADINFPLAGLDLALGFGGQRPGTTREGVNVRANEPLAQASRGGCRPGLSRYIEGRVNGAHLVQHLDYVVDPQAEATPWYDPPYPNPDDAGGPGIAGGPNPLAPSSADGLGPVFGTYTDSDGNVIRYGGTGVRRTKRRKSSGLIQLVQTKNSAGGSTLSVAFDSNVAAGHAILVAFAYESTVDGAGHESAAFTVSDSLGNAYTQLGGYVTRTATVPHNRGYGLGLFYCISAFSGACTVTSNSVANFVCGGSVLEYKNVKAVSPLDGSSTNSLEVASSGSITATTGSIAVSAGSDLVVGFFLYTAFSSGMLNNGTGFTDRVDFGASLFLGVGQDRLAGGALESTRNWDALGSSPNFDSYVSVGASFKKA